MVTTWEYRPVDTRAITLYFAYGSNLDMEQMQRRCPDSKPVCQGILLDHKLIFRGVADVIPADGRFVTGALYSISSRDLQNLDRYEGYPRLYNCKTIKVFTKEYGVVDAFVYIMVPGTSRYNYGLPDPFYYGIIEQGFKDWNLDLKYLRKARQQTRDIVRSK